jgi:allantoinase
VHAEAPELIMRAGEPCARSGLEASSYAAYLSTRPAGAELAAVRLMTRLAAEYGARIHVVHVSAGESVDELARARGAGIPISGETCPHYLTFSADDVAAGATEFKCAPPIREAPHREALWAGLERGALDLVATDHSPAPPAMKTPGDFTRAWGGIASLELALAAVWTVARPRGFSLVDLARWMSAAPAALAGMTGRKGAIAVGRDADVIIWNPDATFVVDPCTLQQRHKLTPYAGRTIHGIVRATLLRGERVWGEPSTERTPAGRLL